MMGDVIPLSSPRMENIESRIDYIAIPTCIHFHEVTTWVAEDLELGGARIDQSCNDVPLQVCY